jgi:shikimate dehydrogenase
VSDVIAPDRFHELPTTRPLYGVIGHPVAHSLSPQMQLAGFRAAGIDAAYVRIDVKPDELTDCVARMRDAGFAGWNCTLPHKNALAKLMDQLDGTAQLSGGVNTVLHDEGKLIGFNTDGQGWARAIRDDFSLDVRDLRILILGVGGAGRALAMQAAMEKCERLVIVNRTEQKAVELLEILQPMFASTRLLGSQERIERIAWDEKKIAEALNTIDLLVNTTSVGLKAYDPPVLSPRLLQPHLAVYDTIYRPAETKFLRAAREAGARAANGLSMLLHQGALAFEIWANRPAPLSQMRQALRAAAGE